jgi:hypothetical protein
MPRKELVGTEKRIGNSGSEVARVVRFRRTEMREQREAGSDENEKRHPMHDERNTSWSRQHYKDRKNEDCERAVDEESVDLARGKV